MSGPRRYIARAVIFLVLAIVVAGVLFEVVLDAFLQNPWLNGLILTVLLIGIVYNLGRMIRLSPEARWVTAYRTASPGVSMQEPPRLVAPIATALGERQRNRRASFSAVSLRYLMDSLVSRLDESRDIARYLTGLLIFLGLLGTFWGLLGAISSIGEVIGNLSMGSTDTVALFEQMIAGLREPLASMGTSFSASLFGLAGSLLLGFLDLQATQAQNAFYNDLEEWLATLARLSGPEQPGFDLPSGGSMPAYVSAMLQQTADNLDGLTQLMTRGEHGRGELTQVLGLLSQRLAALDDRMQREASTTERLLSGQQDLVRQLSQRGEGGGLDPATRDHIRNTDLQLGRMLDELSRGRGEMTRELRQEIKLVSRTIAIVAGEPQAVRD